MISRKYRFLILGILILGILLLYPTAEAWAQCPMCRISAETNLASGGTEGTGLNKGILLLLGLPYVIIGTFGVIWWKNKLKPEIEND